MLLHEDLSYLEQLMLLTHSQRMEALPYDVLQTPRFKRAWLKLDPQVRNRLFTLWWGHYRAIAWWMRLPLLEIYQLLSENEFEAFVNVRPEADFATARFFWARRVYPLSPLVQEFTSLEDFCYALEASDFIKWLELTGVMGSPALSKEGRLLGKTEGLELDIAALEDLKNDFKLALSGDLCLESLESVGCDPSFELTLTDEVLGTSLISVIGSEGDDTALASACMEFIEAKLKLQRTVGKKKSAESHSAYYVASPHQLFITCKGVKTPRPNFMPKRGRGRPPKGSNVKKY